MGLLILFLIFYLCCVPTAQGLTSAPNDPCKLCAAAECSLFQEVGRNFYLSHPVLSKADAQYACGRINGHLIEFDSTRKYDRFLSNLEPDMCVGEHVWIGGVVNFRRGNRVFSEQSRRRSELHADWHNREPDSDRGECVALYRRPEPHGIKMTNDNCTSLVGRFVCEL